MQYQRTMKIKKTLLLYKRSAFHIYFVERRSSLRKDRKALVGRESERFEKAHLEHYAALKIIEETLRRRKVPYEKYFRGQKVNYRGYDLVITVGGDGTLLEAARNLRNQTLLGVNSSPAFSVGRLCAAHAENFEIVFQKILNGVTRPVEVRRLSLKMSGMRRPVEALNDVLICHENPGAMSRYYLKIGSKVEEQRSSGIWMATAAGSSGAIHSAGGKILPLESRAWQYLPRELYAGFNARYLFKGGTLNSRQSLEVTSLMRRGMIYVDGAHVRFSLPYGKTVKILLSPNSLQMIPGSRG